MIAAEPMEKMMNINNRLNLKPTVENGVNSGHNLVAARQRRGSRHVLICLNAATRFKTCWLNVEREALDASAIFPITETF